MFKAMLLVCALATPNECLQFEDTRGPYATHKECTDRVQEMAANVTSLFPVPATYSFKCSVGEQT